MAAATKGGDESSPRYSAEAAKVRGWLGDLQTREAYVSAYEKYYQSVKLGLGLRERFGGYPDFALTKLPGEWQPGRYPQAIVPVEFGSFFVGFTRP
jgi:hypothetical protein